MLLKTGNATEAYKQSYAADGMKPATINRKAKELTDNGKIAARLKKLQSGAAKRAILSKSWVLEQLMDNARLAKGTEDFTASNKALELLGKTDELQMFVDRKHVDSDNRHHHTATPVSDFDEFLEGAIRGREERTPEKPVQN